MRFLELCLQRFQLVQSAVLLPVLDGRSVPLLLLGKTKQQQILRQHVDGLLPSLHQTDGRPLPLLLQMEFLLLPSPLVVVLQFLHPRFLGTDPFHLLEVSLPVPAALPHLVNFGEYVILLVLARLATTRGGGCCWSISSRSSRRRRSGHSSSRGGLFLPLLPRERLGNVGIVERILLGGVTEPFLDPSRSAGGPSLLALFEGFPPGGQFGKKTGIGKAIGNLALLGLVGPSLRPVAGGG
mmetsp:Transcript_4308/g.9324  ORF Transcript_4308/g.9324 Transcript_4308/m.9324 type:complete len:239 (+) Transcript_4308:1780-2496(+)